MSQPLRAESTFLIDTSRRYRLVTRSDFDGLVCAVLLKHLDILDDIKFVHPKDMQDGKVEITENDITTNVPYVSGCYLAFDHHLSETIRNGAHDNHVIDADAPSAARVVYDYLGGADTFPSSWEEMMVAVDKADSAQYVRSEVLIDDAVNRLLQRERDSRHTALAGCHGAHRTLRDHEKESARSNQALCCHTWQPGRAGLARGRTDLSDQPLYDLRAVSGVQHLHPPDVGTEETKRGLRHGQVDFEPQLQYQRR